MFTLNCKGRLLVIEEPIVMGIINATPDSFYEGSRRRQTDEILERAESMIRDGAAILDLGGQSTRPGSLRIEPGEETARVVPAIHAIHSRFPEQIISIDSYNASVVKEAIDAGASIINDVSAGSLHPGLIEVVAKSKLPYVLMHMRGDPGNMQSMTDYENVTLDVFDSLNKKAGELKSKGINDIIIDPGFGFAKTISQNFKILKDLEFFKSLNYPLLVGLSRKATVYKTLGITPGEALNGTTVLHTIALMNGASILRVHDVKEAVEAIRLTSMVRKS